MNSPEVEFLEELQALCRLARKKGDPRKARVAIDMEIELQGRIDALKADEKTKAKSAPALAHAA